MARNPGTRQNGGSFDEATIEAVWQKGRPVPGYEDPPLSFRPFLRQHQPCFDGLAEAYLVCEQCAFRERRTKCEQRGINLVGIQVDLCVGERRGELLDAIGRTAARQFVREVLGVIVG